MKIEVLKSGYIRKIIDKFFLRFLPNRENILAISLLKSEIAKWENGLKGKRVENRTQNFGLFS